MPRTSKKLEQRPIISIWPSKSQIESLTPLAIAGMGFILGITMLLTGNMNNSIITLAGSAITGACGVASNNSKDDIELEYEQERWRATQTLGNNDGGL